MRLPVHIHPELSPAGGHIVTFRDGSRLVPEYLAEFVTTDNQPDLTFQEWVARVANKGMENRFVDQALGPMRLAHFGR